MILHLLFLFLLLLPQSQDFQLHIEAFAANVTEMEEQEGYFPLGPAGHKVMLVVDPKSELYARLRTQRGKDLTLIFRFTGGER